VSYFELVEDVPTLASATHYTYDVFNRRIAKHLDTDGDEAVDRDEFYVYDGTDIVMDFVDVDGEGEGDAVVLAARYLWGPAEDQLLAQETYDAGLDESVQTLWAAADHQGSVRDYLAFDGEDTTVYVHFALDTFGNILSGDTFGIRYLYTGQEFDAETGDYYYDHRYYDPTTGRFKSEDWMGFQADTSNLYRYVGNAPTMFVDPNGLLTIHYWSALDGWGHASITLEDGTYISWWPQKEEFRDYGIFNWGYLISYYSVPAIPNRTLADDERAEAPEGSTKPRKPENFVINGLNEKAIKNWWEKFRKNNANYWSTFGSNCSTIVASALCVGGARPWHDTSPGIWTPDLIEDYANWLLEHGPKPHPNEVPWDPEAYKLWY
jgi:RHS repeat-associated protein